MGVLNLYGKTTNNGATPLELANELLITSTTLKNEDWIVVIIDKIRELTDGQFISKTENNYFYIDLKAKIDYDLVIERKIQNLSEGTEDQDRASQGQTARANEEEGARDGLREA